MTTQTLVAPARSDRKVAPGTLDIRPNRILAVYGKRHPVPLDRFEARALEMLNRPCVCAMCVGTMKPRSPKQAEGVRHDLARNRFKRAVVMCRDGWSCRECGAEDDLTIDHIVGPARGGSNAYHNLQVLCVPCHVTKPDSHSPHLLARHLANLIDDVFPLIQPTNMAELARVNRVRRLIENIRAEAVA